MKPLSLAASLGAAAAVTSSARFRTLGDGIGAGRDQHDHAAELRGLRLAQPSKAKSPSRATCACSSVTTAMWPRTAVVFDARDVAHSAAERIADVETFSKGANITHEFHYMNVHAGESLQVAEVRYADGTVWTDSRTPG